MEFSTVKLVMVLLSVIVSFSYGVTSTSACEHFETCNDPPWNLDLAVVRETSVQYLNLFNNSTITTIFHNNEHHPACLTANVRDKLVYWTAKDEKGLPAIYRSSINTTLDNTPEIFVDAGIYDPKGISYDWITGNIYFIDSKLSQILVCPTKAPIRCAEILQEENGKPYDIAVDPNEGLMFWTVNEMYPAIKKARMDGTLAVSLISTDVYQPVGISVDGNRVFWADVKRPSIESVRYDGTDRIFIKEATSLGIGIFGDSVYYTSSIISDGILLEKCNKENCQNVTFKEIQSRPSEFYDHVADIAITHLSSQPISRKNSCDDKKCSHICVLSGPDDAQCICSVGLVKNGTSCSVDSVKPKIFVAQNTTLLIMSVDTIGNGIFGEILLPTQIKSIDALVYNPVNNSVILFDGISKKIFNFKHDTNNLEILVEHDILNVVSMDIDFLSQNLFWLDAGMEQLEMFSLRSRARTVVYKNVKNGHQVVNDLGSIYVAKTGVTGKQEVHVVYLKYNGREELLKIFNADLLPVQMTCDPLTHMLMIASSNGSYVTIQSEYTAYREHFAFSLNVNGGQIDALTKLGDRIFWLDESNQMKVLTPGDILDGKYLLETITINDDRISNKSKKLIASYPGSEYVDEYMKIFVNHFCSYKSNNFCPQFCIPDEYKKEGDRIQSQLYFITDGSCFCETGLKHGLVWEHGLAKKRCVEADSNKWNHYNLNVEPSEYVENIPSEVNVKGESNGWFWVCMFLSLIIGVLGCILCYTGWYWRKTRSIPFIIRPFLPTQEEDAFELQ